MLRPACCAPPPHPTPTISQRKEDAREHLTQLVAQIPENDEEVDYKQIAVDAAEADIDDAKDQLAHALAHYNAKKALLREEELRFKLVEEFETLGKSTGEVEFARADRTEMMMRAPPLAMATVFGMPHAVRVCRLYRRALINVRCVCSRCFDATVILTRAGGSPQAPFAQKNGCPRPAPSRN